MPKVSFSSREVTPETFSDCIHPLHTDLLDASNDISRRDALIRLQKLVTGMTAANLALALAPAHTSAQEKEEAPLLTFDGKDDAVIIPTLQYRGGDPLCIDTIVVPHALTQEQTIIGDMHSGGFGLQITKDGHVQLSMHNGEQYVRIQSDAPLAAKEFVRITVLCDSQKRLCMYIDGMLQQDSTLWQGTYRPSKQPLCIGADPDGTGKPQHRFVGSMHQLRVSAAYPKPLQARHKDPFGKPDNFDLLYIDPETGEDQSRFKHKMILQGKDE